MRSPIFLALAVALVPTLAQTISETEIIVQSANFNLVVQSTNSTLNNQVLAANHNGAAHEELALFDFPFNATDNFVSFQLNQTEFVCTETFSNGTTVTIPCTSPTTPPALEPGVLTWNEPFTGVDGPSQVSQAMGLGVLYWTNVAIAQITFLGEDAFSTSVAFDEGNKMFIYQTQDDTLEPGSELLTTPKMLYRWFICDTYYFGYTYQALTWVLGVAAPQNPTCQAVNVTRVFT